MKKAILAVVLGLVMISSSHAAPGQGIHTGPWVFSPYVNLSGTYDSNVDRTSKDNETDDLFMDSEAGLKLGYSAYQIDFSGLGFLGYRNYSDLTDKDFSYGGEVLKFKQGTHDTVAIEADQTFRKVDDIDQHGSEAAVAGVSPDSVLDASARTERDINSVGLSAGRNLTDKLQMDIGYRFDDVNYDSAEFFDLNSHIGQAEAAYRLTEKTASILTVRGGIQDNGEVSDPANYYTARVGMKTRGTDKLSFKGGVGVQQFDRTDADDVTAFNYDLTASLAVTDKIVVQAGGRNGTLLSSLYAVNGAEYDSVWAGAFYTLSPTILLLGDVAYRRDDYLDAVPTATGLADRVDDGIAYRVRADYQTPAKFLRLYSQLTYQTVDSTVVTDYEETRVDLGMNLRY
jgi:hypothetical protein